MARTYLERKEAWAAKMRSVPARTERVEGRLPPGQHTVKELPVLDLGIHPEVAPPDWQLEIGGLVEEPLVMDWEGLMALPQVEITSDFHCVTTWSKYDCGWGGVPMAAILDLVKPKDQARFVLFSSHDDYTTNLPVAALFAGDALLATSLDGEPLSVQHGGPVRVVIPQLYAWKSAKFIRKIDFLAEDAPGYWEQRGYSNTADPWLEERFSGEEVPGWRD
ncbi:MAG: sulfite oxidase-like oxidoreductase [Verrucomicrobiales bacterium]|nr:sulfite oxidase-like oxidoreductase [Verrucomicrobiales bacterium]